MKKIFTLFAAVVAAMSMSATITNMTCAEAKDAALNLQSGATGTDTVCVTGYVTTTDGTISRAQQTFWMDDVKGTTQTFQSYWGNLPQELVAANTPLNVGDKVSITGFLMNYNGTTAEMKNGAVVVIERVVVKIDTIDVTVCEAVEETEALNDKETTVDYYYIEKAIVTSMVAVDENYNNASFYVTCDDNNTQFEGYKLSMVDSVAPAVGDTVKMFGKLTKYGTTLEMTAGYVEIIGKAVANTISCNVSFATATGMELARGAQSQSKYVITGYVDSIATAYSEQYNNITFFMCDDMANPTYEFEAYRVKGGADLKVGDKVVVTGYIQHYYKAATDEQPEVELVETVAGATYELLSGAAVENVKTSTKAMKVIENGQLIIIKDGVRYNALGAKL